MCSPESGKKEEKDPVYPVKKRNNPDDSGILYNPKLATRF
jgi:hypothetical protein